MACSATATPGLQEKGNVYLTVTPQRRNLPLTALRTLAEREEG